MIFVKGGNYMIKPVLFFTALLITTNALCVAPNINPDGPVEPIINPGGEDGSGDIWPNACESECSYSGSPQMGQEITVEYDRPTCEKNFYDKLCDNYSESVDQDGNIYITTACKPIVVGCPPTDPAPGTTYKVHAEAKVFSTYECVEDYYGTPTSASDQAACKKCPSGTGWESITDYPGAQDETSCYIKKEEGEGTRFTNSKGTYVLTDDCYY